MEGWNVYIDIFVVTKTLHEGNARKEIPGRRDQGIGTLSKVKIQLQLCGLLNRIREPGLLWLELWLIK